MNIRAKRLKLRNSPRSAGTNHSTSGKLSKGEVIPGDKAVSGIFPAGNDQVKTLINSCGKIFERVHRYITFTC
ncbi:hypothetical protein CORMATOL_00274 [Corynebacterium matruchotii ATCC 33806]|uniref:Uncharacterized protein n=1 Tax=Corynebacterium matruchotii ATCC 33806 TaxID=566549 RepID=C0DZX8_9CORY|nr:hypothetical protein CORMATOL_00274 [Corynebacterium matruchotii ATCC 33806]